MSNQQDFAFHPTAEDATAAAIHKAHMPMQRVALELWPRLKLDSAYARLRGCLNPDRPEKLSADEHLLIARLTNQYDFLHYCATELHHSRPEPVEPEDERAQLQRQFIESTKALQKLAERIESVDQGNVRSIAG